MPTRPSRSTTTSAPCLIQRAIFVLPLLAALFTFAGLSARVDAQAQGFSLNGYAQPPSLHDGLALQLPGTPGHLQVSAALTLDLALAPLVATASSAQDAGADLVGQRLQAHGAFALGLGERFELFAVLPLVITQSGDDPGTSGFAVPVPSSAGLGDVSVGGSALLLGERDRGAQLGLTAALALPTGSTDALAGDGGVGARGGLMFAVGSQRLRFAVESGARFRPDRAYGQTEIGSELYARGGVHFGFGESLRLMLEAQAASRLSRFMRKYESPAEALIGMRYGLSSGLHLGAGIGLGLTQAPGVPSVRGLLTIGYALEARADGNRISIGEEDAETTPEPIPDPPDDDIDDDGISDADDRCPSRAEDMDGFEDDDGCPDDDNDRDGISDADDRCPNQAEEMTGGGDGDGCPGGAEPEPAPAPTPTPRQAARPAQTPEAEPTERAPGWQVVTDALPPPITFDFQSDHLTPEAEQALIEFAQLARRYPRVRLAVEGHASLEADAIERTGELRQRRGNREISEARADRVMRLLVARGVRPTSIVSRGFGAERPVTSNDSESGRIQNRRVEIRVLR